jgi:hypothetical protein
VSKEREARLQSNLSERTGSLDLKMVKELCLLRLERYKNDLVNNESEQIRGKAKEIKELLKILSTTELDSTL